MKHKKRQAIPFDKAHDPAHVSHTLPDSPCQHLMQSLNTLKAVEAAVFYHLPEQLRPHCRVGSFKAGVLTLITSTATWATLLRGASRDLRFALRRDRDYAQLRDIVVRVKPEQIKTNSPQRSLPSVKPPSEESRRVLASTADSVTHPELKAALARLAGRA